jgi:hypothetical protein
MVQNIRFEEGEEAGREGLKTYRVGNADRKKYLYQKYCLKP